MILHGTQAKTTHRPGGTNLVPTYKREEMLLWPRKTPPKFPQSWINHLTQGFWEKEHGHCVARYGISHSFNKSGSVGLRKEKENDLINKAYNVFTELSRDSFSILGSKWYIFLFCQNYLVNLNKRTLSHRHVWWITTCWGGNDVLSYWMKREQHVWQLVMQRALT